MMRMLMNKVLCLFWITIHTCMNVGTVMAGSESFVVLSRGAQDNNGLSTSSETTNDCNFEEREIVFSHPMSIELNDKHYVLGSQMFQAATMTIDAINSEHCGVKVDGKNYPIRLNTYGDNSSKDKVATITKKIVNETDFLLSTYTSGLNAILTPIAQENGKLVVTGGTSRRSVHSDKDLVFGIIPPANTYLYHAFMALKAQGAQTVVSVQEDDVAHCSPTKLAEEFDMTVLEEINLGVKAPFELNLDAAYNVSKLNPDVVITCVRTNFGVDWIKALRQVRWSPKAQVFTIWPGRPELEVGAGTDIQYMMGLSSWSDSLPPIPDPITGWTPHDFATNYEAMAFGTPSYQHSAMSASISVFVQAIQNANTFNDTETIRDVLANDTFDTIYGKVRFDPNGQNLAPFMLLQYDSNEDVHVLSPKELKASDYEIVYPMPTFDERDCIHVSPCTVASSSHGYNNTCNTNGQCICHNEEYYVSVGIGPSADCIPREKMNMISDSQIMFGYVIVSILSVCCLFCTGWAYLYRQTWIVKTSQIRLLIMVVFGCFLSSLSILFMGVQTDYRKEQDDLTREPIGDTNSDIDHVDRSCMAVPWLYGIGFVVTFSMLFAKIQRVQMIYKAHKEKRKKAAAAGGGGNNDKVKEIGFLDVAHIVAVMLVIEVMILVVWQLASPFRWERNVQLVDDFGFPLESVGSCTSSSDGWWYQAALIGFHILCLFYALVLCFQTRDIHSDFAESSYISLAVAFMFQVLVLTIPIGALLLDDPTVFYVLRVCAVALQNITVLALIFIPKMIKTVLPSEDNEEEDDVADPTDTGDTKKSKKKKKKTIPLAALTFCKWDEAVDTIDELLQDDSDTCRAMSESQRDQMKKVKQLLLHGADGGQAQGNKILHLPSTLLGEFFKRSTNNSVDGGGGGKKRKPDSALKYIANEFGGVNVNDIHSEAASTTMPFPDDVDDFPLVEREHSCTIAEADDDQLYTPPEFKRLGMDAKIVVAELLSWSALQQWDFNIFDLMKVTDGNPLVFLGWAILGAPHAQFAMMKACGEHSTTTTTTDSYTTKGYNFVESALQIQPEKLCNYLRAIEEDYLSHNPYHNAIHAADVLQSLHSMIQMTENELHATTEELFSILLAAAVHDVEHPGKNNAFQINSRTELAMTYNDVSVLENKHASHAFTKMLAQDAKSAIVDGRSVNLLCNASSKQLTSIRKKVIDAILHTDMSKHFQFVNSIKALLLNNEVHDLTSDNRWKLLVYMMHVADISGTCRPGPMFMDWATRCYDEFFLQGDREAELGLPISPLCDRATTKVPESQVGFLAFVVQPCFETLAVAIPMLDVKVLPIIRENKLHWESLKEPDQDKVELQESAA